MIKYILTLALIMTFQGCKQSNLTQVSYKYQYCESPYGVNVGIKLDSDGVYRCVYGKNKIKKPIKRTNGKHTFKNPSWINIAPIDKCDTTVTTVYKDGAVRCKGKILEEGQVSTIKHVNK